MCVGGGGVSVEDCGPEDVFGHRTGPQFLTAARWGTAQGLCLGRRFKNNSCLRSEGAGFSWV